MTSKRGPYEIKGRILHDGLGCRDATAAERWAFAEIERLRAIEKAARAYYLGYCQDEADEEGICDLEQQRAAQALRDAIRNTDA